MPIAQNQTPPIRQVAILGLGLVMTIATMVFLVSQADRLTGADRITFGDQPTPQFSPGNVDRLARDIANAGPLLLPDISGGDRDVYLNHVGDDDTTGWAAFAVRLPEAARDCFVEWIPDDEVFRDICDEATYPALGQGLPQFPVTIDADGELTINLGLVSSQ